MSGLVVRILRWFLIGNCCIVVWVLIMGIGYSSFWVFSLCLVMFVFLVDIILEFRKNWFFD